MMHLRGGEITTRSSQRSYRCGLRETFHANVAFSLREIRHVLGQKGANPTLVL